MVAGEETLSMGDSKNASGRGTEKGRNKMSSWSSTSIPLTSFPENLVFHFLFSVADTKKTIA